MNGGRRSSVILDPDKLLNDEDFEGVLAPPWISSWYELRRWWENSVQGGRADGAATAVVRKADMSQPRDLPWDIEIASKVVRVLPPVATEYVDLLRDISNRQSDAAVEALNDSSDPIGACLERVWSVTLSRRATKAKQLQGLVELRIQSDVPDSLWPLLRPRLSDPEATALAETPPNFGPLQAAWDDWVTKGPGSRHHETLAAVGPTLKLLFETHLLREAAYIHEGVPAWVSSGVRVPSPVERTQDLLAEPMPTPTSHEGWVQVAKWWGAVRAAMGEGVPSEDPVRSAAWARWRDLNEPFRAWLRQGLEAAMSSADPWPRSVNKIAPYLARRLRQGRASRVMLIVIDGMGFAQWEIIREGGRISVLEEGASFAMVPTITPVSRQAIFAGRLPMSFPDTIETTAHEGRRWRDFWSKEGAVYHARYSKIQGIIGGDFAAPHDVNVQGCVINAVDEIMHGARVLGEMQMMAGVRTWAKDGVLNRLVKQASADGFEVWITSDHGNIEAEATGRPKSPGLEVDMAGTRVWLYKSATLRDSSDSEGTDWDPPGIPAGVFFPRFANARGGYFNAGTRMSHGSLSFDEVIVPLARVEA
jgi:hypothetical protein